MRKSAPSEMSRAKREWGVGKVSFAVLGGSITRHESLSPDTLKCQGFKIFQNNECFVDCGGVSRAKRGWGVGRLVLQCWGVVSHVMNHSHLQELLLR